MANALANITGTYIDSRDLIRRLEALDDLIGNADTVEEHDELEHDELIEERNALAAVCDEGANTFADWEHGVALIPDFEFEDYAQDFARDIGAIGDTNGEWPLYCIDWERAANDLKMDFSSIEIDGTTYWGR